MITFLLNDKLHNIENSCPNTTVLDYLRNKLNKTGTKEGCASGDCGACTVVVGELHDDHIEYKNINSCIALIASLHGKQLITVEDLADASGLHPVQQAMVDCHGSQCGFCTPGFIMSMFAMRQNLKEPSREDIEEYLSGNLCRCTGYQPILNAASEMYKPGLQEGLQDKFNQAEKKWIELLKEIATQQDATLSFKSRRFFNPHSEDELAELLLEHKDARLFAGGTDLSLEITQQLKTLDTIIFLANVKELQEISETEESFTLGSAVTYSQSYDLFHREYPEFAEMMLRLGSRQIRNVGTIGGNIANASPVGDSPPGLIAMGAILHLRKGGNRREVLLEDYFLDYKKTVLESGEYISQIEIPKLASDAFFKMIKISKRIDDDISAVAAAFTVKLDDNKVVDIKIAYGGMAAIPKRATAAEQQLIGQQWNEQNIVIAMKAMEQDFSPLSDVRASSAYRMQVAKNLLYKCYLESLGDAEVLRITDYE